jgi:hypothetical protein
MGCDIRVTLSCAAQVVMRSGDCHADPSGGDCYARTVMRDGHAGMFRRVRHDAFAGRLGKQSGSKAQAAPAVVTIQASTIASSCHLS